MAAPDNTYSRIVGWLKIVLPLLALALLSTLFLVARTVDPAQDLPFADVDIDELAREQRIGAPDYATVTEDGAAISLSAASAQPDPERPGSLSGTQVRSRLDLPSGAQVDIEATRMDIDGGVRVARLGQGVTVRTSDGYVMQTDAVEVALDETRVASDTPTRLTGPVGQLSADTFTLTGQGSDDRPYRLVFKGNVKLVYDPNE